MATLGEGTYLDYTIEVGGYQVFAGRAYSKTGAVDLLYAKINDIVADYMGRVLPAFGSSTTTAIANPISNITAVVKVAGNVVASVEFTPDWSYDFNYVRETDGISFPIDGWIVQGQHLLYSDLGSPATPTMRVTYMGERGDFQPWLGSGNGSFNNDFFISGWWEDITLTNSVSGARDFYINLAPYADLYKVEIEGHTWRVWPGCCRYVLHYINAYGGWDSLLIRGNGKQTDTLKRYTRKEPYYNGTYVNRGTENYVNEMGVKYELHPGTMTEAQAARMPHLLNSCCVYLEDMQEGKIWPVALTNTTSEHKTWANQGHKLVEYTIECELAQDRLRR